MKTPIPVGQSSRLYYFAITTLVCKAGVTKFEMGATRLLLGLAFLLAAFTVHAQTYSIDWFTIDGGGGTCTGGFYSVSGTLGQADAGGPMTYGQYSVTGGFWVLPTTIQIVEAPTLRIVSATPGNATISWSPIMSGYVLQETLSLSPAQWFDSPSGASNPIVIQAEVPMKFYRLLKP